MSERLTTPRIPLRRSLLLAMGGLALGLLLAFAAALYAFIWIPARVDVADAQLRAASAQVETRLQNLVSRVETTVQLNRDWGERGVIDVNDPEAFNSLYMPILQRRARISSVVLADESGRELLLLHQPDGTWLNRLTDPQASPGQARFLYFDAQGNAVGSETKPLAYDARERPWFKGGMALTDPRGIYWSEPYVFRSTQQPGLSVVVQWKAPDGSRRVMTTDLKLIDLSNYTREITVGQSGFLALFSDDGKLLGVPSSAQFADEAQMAAAVLQPLDMLGNAPLSAAAAHWRRAGMPDGDLQHFAVDGQSWLATVRRTQFGQHGLWVATMAPEHEFSLPSTGPLLALALIGAITMAIAWLLASELARRFADPLGQLVRQAARIGRLELDEPAAVQAPWQELDELAAAQEVMRRELLAATRRLAEANESLESKVVERTRELANARDAAHAAARAKADFLANMSHEIRTPMNAIIGLTDLALRTPLTPRQLNYLRNTQAAAVSLLGVINDVLDFSKIDAGRLELSAQPFNLQTVFDRITAVIGLKAQEKGLELLINTAPDVPGRRLVGDSLRLEQVLINLCSNAVKFTEAGEIVLVTVKLLAGGGDSVTLRFAVRDTGIGMDAEQTARLFRPFEQLDPSITRKHGGTGLGLAICRRLVSLMGGEIGVHSQRGVGSEFHFTTRFGLADEEVEDPDRPTIIAPVAARILVCDDSANARDIFHTLLQGLGYEATIVASGEQALAELGRAAAPFDLVLLDWRMPGLDGFEVVRRFRAAHPHLAKPPKFILVTAYGDETISRRAADEGLDGCLTKPVNESTLVDAIGTALGTGPLRTSELNLDPAAATTLTAPPALKGRRVLLAEDNELNQLVASELLGMVAGMDVTIVADGRAAVDFVRTQSFDVVLMDVQMPEMDGYTATTLIRQDPRHAHLPIIAVTAHAMAEDFQRCMDAGMNDRLTKPFVAEELFGTLMRWLVPAAVAR